MKIVGNSKQDGIPKPDNPVQITNETVLIITDKEGNKKEMPFKYEKILKEGDKTEKIKGEWCLVRREPMNDIEILEEFLEDYIHDGLAIQYRVIEAIENLIQRNKDLEQIEKEHKEENGRLREENKNLEKELEEKDMQHELELIGKEESTKANMAEIIEHYYTANEDCIPKSKIKEKMELLREDIQYSANPLSIDNSKYAIEVLEELLEESEK